MKNKRLRCPECEKGILQRERTDIQGRTHGESFQVTMDALMCPACGFKTIEKEKMGEFALRVSDAYRKRHGLLTSQEIKERRAALEQSQEQFAAYLGVGIASVKRWELGHIQDRANDNLIRLKTEPEVARRNYLMLLAHFGGVLPEVEAAFFEGALAGAPYSQIYWPEQGSLYSKTSAPPVFKKWEAAYVC